MHLNLEALSFSYTIRLYVIILSWLVYWKRNQICLYGRLASFVYKTQVVVSAADRDPKIKDTSKGPLK